MTQEQIEKAAKDQAISSICVTCLKRRYVACRDHGTGCNEAGAVYFDFLAGSALRQPEIEALQKENAELKLIQDGIYEGADCWKQEIEDCRYELEQVKEKLREATEWVDVNDRLPERNKELNGRAIIVELFLQNEYGETTVGWFTRHGEFELKFGIQGWKIVRWRKINP